MSGEVMLRDLWVTDGIVIPSSEMSLSAVHASGPGGQNVNKVATKVELRFDFERSGALRGRVKERLRELVKNRLDKEGRLVLTCQVHRERQRNVSEVYERLAEWIRKALVEPKLRHDTKPTRGSQLRRMEGKAQRGAVKKMRSKPSFDD